MSGLLGPKTPKIKPPAPLPDPEDFESKKARGRERNALRASSGRNSTLLTGRGGLGAFTNANIGD